MKNERFKQLKYNKARLAIMGQIAESGLKVGDRLPSVRSFAASLPYGAITISHALNDMKEEGMIECRHGSGTYLARELKEQGEVIIDALGCHWWGRTTSGQAIYMDGVIQKIAGE